MCHLSLTNCVFVLSLVTIKCYKLVFLTLLQRERSAPKLAFDESERRALLLKEWSRYKQVTTYNHTFITSAFMENVASDLCSPSCAVSGLYFMCSSVFVLAEPAHG